MTLREAQALILLYQACRDEALRLRVLKLVPELGDFGDCLDQPQRGYYEMTKFSDLTSEQLHEVLCDWRDIRVEDACPDCTGSGYKTYANTATYHRSSGLSGQAMTNDVCDRCWGSGDVTRPWPAR